MSSKIEHLIFELRSSFLKACDFDVGGLEFGLRIGDDVGVFFGLPGVAFSFVFKRCRLGIVICQPGRWLISLEMAPYRVRVGLAAKCRYENKIISGQWMVAGAFCSREHGCVAGGCF